MASQTATVQVRLNSVKHEAASSVGEVEVRYWDRRDRFKRAALTWAGCWGGAIAVIPFPLVHLVVPPLLLLTGPIAASVVYGRKDVILGGKATCPSCKKPMRIARSKLQWPLSDLCTECSEEARIQPSDSEKA